MKEFFGLDLETWEFISILVGITVVVFGSIRWILIKIQQKILKLKITIKLSRETQFYPIVIVLNNSSYDVVLKKILLHFQVEKQQLEPIIQIPLAKNKCTVPKNGGKGSYIMPGNQENRKCLFQLLAARPDLEIYATVVLDNGKEKNSPKYVNPLDDHRRKHLRDYVKGSWGI